MPDISVHLALEVFSSVCRIEIGHREPQVEDAFTTCLQKDALWALPLARLAQLDLDVVQVGVAIAQFQEGGGIRHVELRLEQLKRREVVPRTDTDRLVVGNGRLQISDYDADVVERTEEVGVVSRVH